MKLRYELGTACCRILSQNMSNVLELLKRLRMKIKFSEINQINVLSMLCQQYGEGELKLGKGKLRFCDKIRVGFY